MILSVVGWARNRLKLNPLWLSGSQVQELGNWPVLDEVVLPLKGTRALLKGALGIIFVHGDPSDLSGKVHLSPLAMGASAELFPGQG